MQASVPNHRKDISPSPRVILHADDLGFNSSVDDGILYAFQHGILTSTSVIANGPTVDQALRRIGKLSQAWLSRELGGSSRRQLLDDFHEPFDVGVHLNLTQGRPLTSPHYPAELLDEQGCFPGPNRLFLKLHLRPRRWLAAIKAELIEQVSQIVERGVKPTHLNGHQYIEMYPVVREILPELASYFSIGVVRLPIEHHLDMSVLRCRGLRAWMLAHIKRHFARRFSDYIRGTGLGFPDAFIGTAHAGRLTLAAIANGLRPPHPQTTEIAVHPGGPDESLSEPLKADSWSDPLAAMRCVERDLLCSMPLVELLRQRQLRLGRLSTLARKESPATSLMLFRVKSRARAVR